MRQFLIAAAVLLTPLAGVSVSGREDKAAAADPVPFTCTQHGPKMMLIGLTFETGTGGRVVEIVGADDTMAWKVTIDGKDATPKDQTPTGKATLAVRAQDKLTWKVVNFKHGVTFADQTAAEGFLDFQPAMGKEFKARTEEKFKEFGKKPWGTDAFTGTAQQPTTLAVATVKGPAKDKK